MNKKARGVGGIILFWMFLLLIAYVGMISSDKLFDTNFKERYDNFSNQGEIMCMEKCPEFNATFFEYNSGGFGNSECWCKRDIEPLRIY